MSIETIIENKSLVKGFLNPLFYEEGTGRSALGPADFQKVVDGYACAKCLAEYWTYLVTCPVCGLARDLAKDLEDPDPLHVAHLQERERTVGQDSGPPKTFDDFMRDVNKNRDIDHIPLSKLKPRKRH